MPAKSKAQQRLMQAAEHGADFPMARTIRQSMTHHQMHDFAVGSEKGKPVRVPKVKATAPKVTAPATGNGDMHRGGSINPYGHLAAALRKKGQ